MKKIYSIVLMATALLLGTNVQAATHKAGNADALVQAFADAQDGDVIEVTADIEIPGYDKKSGTKTISGVKYTYKAYNIPFITIDGKNLTLDLGGFRIFDQPGKYRKVIFYIKKGQLTLKGNGGSIECINNNNGVSTSNPGGGYPVYVSGNDDIDATDGAWTSKLIVEGGVTLEGNATGAYIDGCANAYRVTTDGSKTFNYINGLSQKDIDEANVNVKNGNVVAGPKVALNGVVCAFNAFIDIQSGAKVRGNNYGAQISGNVKYIPDEDKRTYLPTIHIHNGAEAYTLDGTATFSVGAYCAGFGRLIIEGDVHGATGVYAKAGEVEVNTGATIHSDATAYVPAVAQGSSVTCAGSAIVLESNKSYAGDMGVTVSGTAEINGGLGYAVESVVTDAPENKVVSVTLEGGNFTSGDKGCLEVTPIIEDKDNVEIKIDNATFEAGADDQQINLLLAASGDDHIVTAVEDEQGNEHLVIVPLEQGQTVTTNADLNNLAAGEDVIKLVGGEQTLTKNIELVNLTLVQDNNPDGAVVIIPEDITLKVGSITVDALSAIIVRAGGSLVVTGEGGIATYSNSNIIIEAQQGKMGRFYMSPATTSRKNPAATVELSVSCFNGSFQRIGVPAVNGITAPSIVKGDPSVSYTYYYWDKATQDWANVKSATFVMEPFQGIAFKNTAAAAGAKISFPCNLVGNSNGQLDLEGAWTSFANSYTADIDLFAMLSSLLNNNNISAAAYVWNIDRQDWDAISWADLDDNSAPQTALEPMQAFVYNLAGQGLTSASAEINYEEAVWAPKFAPQPVAARRGMRNNATRVVINIVGENGAYDNVTLRQSSEYSAEFDNGSDMRKNLSLKSSNLYANTQLGEMVQVADNNLNGLRLSIATENETMFKMTFSNLNGEQLAIRDNVTGTTIAMTEDAEYFFTVAENSVSERFEIVTPKNAPTDVESVIANENGKAVYTVLGQYVGTTDDWNILPAGIYVVDGVKMVK